ncbi:sensor histidine kinase [Hyphomicrobium facile]|uniref:Histidine kinase-, DNA gyrase B-, and HSP90-like ATPase n=1 Tax=Hyphomicrobium facile TaxID=51670 RepID=A0A1I7MXE2_9HYPH|nr:sensor histidine kinase [Hyphomicrobium facile]SFV27050.1 Histidine kinase-, DNA gyrase B-, and HSP90-like ATPase [Hyphomicrobium facile]
MDLKLLLVRRIVLVALACFAFGSAYSIYWSAIAAKRQNELLAESVGRQLDLQLVRIQTALDIPKRFPDWDLVTTYALQPGQCIQLSDVNGKVIRSSCEGVNTAGVSTPDWFFAAYRHLLNAAAPAARHLSYRGTPQGEVIASSDPIATAAQAWTTISPMLGLSAFLIATLCVVTYWVIDRALAPTKEILAGLNRLAQGDLECRLPAFRLAELNRISEVFNSLSRDLSKAMADRTELARKLVDAQEQERLHIARELHDDVAQQLSGINAVAACVRSKFHRNDPTAAEDASELEAMTSELIGSLRKTLAYLRPSEIDDLGLIQSLRGLVEKHNSLAQGTTHFTLEAQGDLADLSSEASAHVYRIVQEALTNAAKHARAHNVHVKLNKYRENGADKIELAVDDDGCGITSEGKGGLGSWGIIGMRERVLALSGRFAAGPNPSGGFGLRVEFLAQPGS